MSPEAHAGARGIRDQLERYRTAFVAVVSMIVIAALVGGYILAHERIAVPGWVPVIGHEEFTFAGEFQTAQAVAPGQGQEVTIAGAKVGEIASVDLRGGRALVTMRVAPKFARYIYRDATLLLRPKTGLKDMTVAVEPGTPASGRLPKDAVIGISQTAPDVNLDEFLASLDADTRAYLQELLAGAGEGLSGNSRRLAAVFKRFDPLARDAQLIGREVARYHANVARSIHNFGLLVSALGAKDTQLAQVIDSANASLGVFAREDRNVQATLRELPGALAQTNQGLAKLATAAHVLGPTLTALTPFAHALGPAEQQSRVFFAKTTPILESQIRPFLREIEPVTSKLAPSLTDLAQASPGLATSFSVLNEFFNELAYNPGRSQAGFLFFLDWANHNFNSAYANADANGPIGNGLVYFACPQLVLLPNTEKVNPTLHAIISLLHPPSSCPATGAKVARADGQSQLAGSVFARGSQALTPPTVTLEGGP
jgi:phospholipid/cholesterol/gamma-HCH transport system substrate-binding protein